MSQDFVAIESVMLDFLRSAGVVPAGTPDNYLHEAAQANHPPSGTVYDPENDGIPLQSLGVHEHWNNSTDKQYSRNLGTGNGIELIQLINTTPTTVEHRGSDIPNTFSLFTNYPNPFNPSTKIRYAIPQNSYITLKVFDLRGREIATLVNEKKAPGNYEVTFNAGNLTSGIYFYQLRTENYIQTKKMILLQ
ncbi:MAG: T9SS C-terminal target domain-containing protein [Ignavibacteriae bacterium]|nr:MAG: T9SS C-terminal target domain-containing protein [Ignavibacteriota bacterium]